MAGIGPRPLNRPFGGAPFGPAALVPKYVRPALLASPRVVYWVGGTGTWDASATAHWASSSGGTAGYAAPSMLDDVVIDANSGGGTITVNAGAACRNLAVTWTAAKTNIMSFATNFSIGVFKYLGNSAVNRPLFQSSVVGTVRTITVAVEDPTSDFCDFMDIAVVGAAAPLGTLATSIGDCQGNSGITFTTPAAQTSNGTTGYNWSNAARWTSRVPLPQDDVTVSSAFSAGQTLTYDMPRLGKSVTFSHTGTLTAGFGLGAYASFGSWIMGGAWGNNFVMSGLTLRGRGSYSITWAGLNLSTLTIDAPGGTYVPNDTMAMGNVGALSGSALTIVNGTYTAGAFASVIGNTTSPGTITLAAGATLNAGSAIWTINSPSGTTYTVGNMNGTLNPQTATFKFNITGGGVGLLQAGTSVTWPNVWVTGGGIGGVWWQTGSGPSFTSVKVDPGQFMLFNANQTFTAPTWTLSGNAPGGSDARFLRFVNLSTTDSTTTPDAAANRITGDIALVAKVALDVLGSSVSQTILSKWDSGASLAYNLEQLNSANPKLQFTYTQGGSTRTDTATVNTSTVAANGQVIWVAVSHNTTSGVTKFWTSSDGSTWAQLGADVAGTAGATTDFATTLNVGCTWNGTNSARIMSGRVFRGKVFSGVPPMLGGAGSATPVVDINPADYTTGSTFTSSVTGEVWTLRGATFVQDTNQVAIGTQATAATIVKSGGGKIKVDYLSVNASTASPTFTFYDRIGGIDGRTTNTNWNFYDPDRVLSAAAGAYALTGVAAGLRKTWYLSSAAGAYALSGVVAGLRKTWYLSGAAGAYALTGVAAGLRKTWLMPSASGAYSMAGVAATLRKAWRLGSPAGAYSLSGVDAVLIYRNRPSGPFDDDGIFYLPARGTVFYVPSLPSRSTIFYVPARPTVFNRWV